MKKTILLLAATLLYGCLQTTKKSEPAAIEHDIVDPVKERFAKMESDAL